MEQSRNNILNLLQQLGARPERAQSGLKILDAVEFTPINHLSIRQNPQIPKSETKSETEFEAEVRNTGVSAFTTHLSWFTGVGSARAREVGAGMCGVG